MRYIERWRIAFRTLPMLLLLWPLLSSGLAQQQPGTPVLSVDYVGLWWTGVAGAGSYDLVRGDVRTLLETGGDFTLATRDCPDEDDPVPGLPNTDVPAPGEAFWFLVRANVGTGPGSYDSGGAGQVGSRDAEIETAPRACLSPLVAHAKIDISSDAGFTAANGVVSGTGTTADPYVISGWSITCPTGFHAGINLNSTTRPFVIRNVSMQGCTWGIKMYRGPNGRIEKSRVQGSNHGALIDDCDDFAIEGFRVSANSSTSGTGIGLSRSSNVLVAENTITGGLVGISVDTSNGCSLYDNNLIGNTLQAKDTSGGVNAWDAGYPTGGNYWTNYMGADACGGPAQDDCTAPDGIGDTPYVLNAVTADLYPLMVPAFAEGDAGAPWVAITSPADGAVFMTEPIAVTGSASDDGSGLRRVEVRVNGGPWTMANGTSSWNASVDPAPGPNTIEARSLDHAGNVSNVASLGVTYDAPVWEAVMETSKVSYAPGEMVAMTFRLTNRSAFPVTLHFPTDCEMFFRVRSSTGALLFDARNGATCLSVLTQRTWQPNETVTYPGNWNQKNQSGLQVPFPASYDIQGYLDCSEEVPEPIATIDIGVGP